MGNEPSRRHSVFADGPVKPAPKLEPEPSINPLQERIQQLEYQLQETKAKLAKEKIERADQVEDLTRQLEFYSTQVAARRLSDATAVNVDAYAQRLADERAMHLMQQRLNSITEVDDSTFEYISGPLGFDQRDFPFAELKPGRLQDGTLVLRIQLVDAYKGNKDVLDRFKTTLAIMQALNGGDGTLLRLIAACNVDSDDPIAYVEYVTGMPLNMYLMDKQDATWPEKLWIASQIAKAIVHIHNLAVMHRDVSWSRVYVDATGNVKVFAGLKMRQVQAYETYLTAGITEARWGAPETLPKTGGSDSAKPDSSDSAKPDSSDSAKPDSSDSAKPDSSDSAKPDSSDSAKPDSSDSAKPDSSDSATTYTDKIDIFGLGLILISLVTHDLPFTNILKTSSRATSIDDGLVAARLSKRETAIPMLTQSFENKYAKCPSEEYKKLAFACIQYDPERRPTAPEVVRRLEMIRQAYSGGAIKTPDLAKVDVSIALLKASGLKNPKAFASPYDIWCEITIDDKDRDAIQLEPVTGNVTHVLNQYETLHDIEPLAHTVEIVLKTKTIMHTKTIGKISMPLLELLTLEGKRRSLTALRKKTLAIYDKANVVGFLDIAVQFGERLRGYLEQYERQTTEYLRINEDGPSMLDFRKKRDLAAAALLSGTTGRAP